MLSRTREVKTARVGLLATIGVNLLQLLGALLNHSHFNGPSWAVALYGGYSAVLGLRGRLNLGPSFHASWGRLARAALTSRRLGSPTGSAAV